MESQIALRKLKQLLRHETITADERRARNDVLADRLLALSPVLETANFEQISGEDLRLLYNLYDESWFHGLLRTTLPDDVISFRLSRRMTRAGGKTTCWKDRHSGAARYEIAVATTLLFQSFADAERAVTVTGLPCEHRLHALQRVMEHELIHLTEMLVWNQSSCAQSRFQSIASRFFGHTSHQHDLITPRETASTQFGVRPGVRVRFHFEGQQLEGIVNRVTKRATVLVKNPRGQRYSDGHRYIKYYIPVHALEAVE